MRLTKFALRKLIILLIAIFVAGILISAWFVMYKRLHPNFLNINAALARTGAAIRLAQALEPKAAKRALRNLEGRGLHFTLLEKPLENAIKIYAPTKKNLESYLHVNANIEIALYNGRWLQVKRHYQQPIQLLWWIYALLALIIVALVIFCYWTIATLAFPVNELTHAAKRFTRDMQAPPLAETGPSEYRQAMAAFNEMQARLRQLIFDRTQMLTAISHDLQTPITRLQLRVESITDSTQKQKMYSDLEEMSSMIDSILSFARDYRETESVQNFDLNALLETICDEFIDTGKEVKFISQDRLVISGRMLALKRAFSNLIDNAIKYASSAEVSWRQQDNSVMIGISDNGPGIDPSEINKVFQPFYRVDRSRSLQVSGSGLGLSVAADIIRTHGGDIRLTNKKPHGLIVTVELPKLIETS